MDGDQTERGSSADAGDSRSGAEPEVVPERLGRFIVCGVLGRGGMGIVLEAYDEELDRELALKLLHGGTSPHHTERLIREAKALAQLSHPNVVQVYDVGEVAGRMFIAMELVRGPTLAQWQQERRSWRECVAVYLQAGRGLAAAHAAQLVHRDFKPGNCILDERGRVRVLDFGLVRDATDGSSSGLVVPVVPVPVSRDSRGGSLTAAGSVLGTLGYMPLEQFDGARADERSDQFSFCASLHEALYGQRPFPGRTAGQLVHAMMNDRVRPPPPESSVPRRVRTIVLRGLARQPRDRWPTMDTLLRALERTLAPRRASWAVPALGAAFLLGVGVWSWASPHGRCDDANARLAGVWDDARKQEVKDALLGTGLPYAAHTWEHVEPRLDDHARAWAERHAKACEATTAGRGASTTDVDLLLSCLTHSRDELRETVEVLAHANPIVVSNALALVDALPEPARCDDVQASRSALFVPADPRVAAEVEALRERLSRARSLERAGEYDEGLARADAIVAAAEPLHHGPLVAEALLVRGHLRELLGRYGEAQPDLERAYFLAVELGVREVEQEAATWLVRVVAFQQGRFDEGRHWGRTALAVARRAPADAAAEARALAQIGTALWKEGELDQAIEHHQRAMALTEAVLGPEHPLLVDSLNSLGAVASTQGKLDEALAYQERALTLAEAVLGPGHPHVGRSLLNAGIVHMQRGELAKAIECMQRALAIDEAAFGPEHPMVGQAAGNLGSALVKQGRLDEGLLQIRRAIAILERANGPEHPSLYSPLSQLAAGLAQQGRLDEALEQQRRVVAIAEASLPAGHPRIASAWNDMAVYLNKRGQLDDALELARRALASYEKELGPDDVMVSYPLVHLGRTLLERGDVDEAEPAFERALAVVERAWGPQHVRTVAPRVGLAMVALARGDHAAAREQAEQAVGILAAGEPTAGERAEAELVLGQALWWEPNDRARAHALVRGAYEVFARAPSWHRAELGQAKAWLAEHPAPGR
jgi:tetratricopeptide (TPR) repeat protein